MKVSILDYESDLVPDMMDPSICQLFEIEFCKNSGEVEGVHAISSTENGKFKEWDFTDLPAADQLKIRKKITDLVLERQRSLQDQHHDETRD